MWYFGVMATVPIAIVMIYVPMATLRELSNYTIAMPFYMCLASVISYGLFNIAVGDSFFPDDSELEEHGIAVFWVLTFIVNGVLYNLAW